VSEFQESGLTSRIVQTFLSGNLSALLIIVALLAGAFALQVTPREEDPQIVVPVVDVLLSVPGAGAEEVERQVTARLEKLLYEVDGVEYVYSASEANGAVVTARFTVGENREDSLFKIYNKISMNADRVPAQLKGWVVKPVEIDDVPMLTVTLYGDEQTGDATLRRVAEEMESKLKGVENTGPTAVLGGRVKKLLVQVDPQALAAHGVGWAQLMGALSAADVRLPAGILRGTTSSLVEVGERLRSRREVEGLVVGVQAGAPVYLRDLARVELAPEESGSYCRIGFGPRLDPSKVPEKFRDQGRDFPAVMVTVAKKKGSNAVRVGEALVERLEELQGDLLPAGVHWTITRDYGETADHKVNELIEGLVVAIVIVIALIAMTLGWREGLIVAAAVPVTFALTLLLNWLAGYTINRVTLFAMILSLGLVVDDPIVDVENIHRHLRMRRCGPMQAVLEAVNEVRPPIILATLAIIVSFLPLFFISGMMGPYMAPMALNVPIAMLMSLFVAFTVTPWMSYHILKGEAEKDGGGEAPVLEEDWIYRSYAWVLRPFFASRGLRWSLVLGTVLLFGASCWLGANRSVPLKMLPYDNKNELQILIDMPRGTPLQRTEAAAAELALCLRRVAEVTDVTSFSGVPGPMDFNGLVRHYYLRNEPHLAELRVNFIDKKLRVEQSHEIGLRLRKDLGPIAKRLGARIKIVELPPGPPVLSTVVAEVYGKVYTPYSELLVAAGKVAERLGREPGVVDLDSTIDDPQSLLRFSPDREKLRLAGLTEQELAVAIHAAIAGQMVAVLHDPHDVNPTPIELRLPRASRTRLDELGAITMMSRGGAALRLSELGRWEHRQRDQRILRKNLRRVVFVTAELAGRVPAEVVLDVAADQRPAGSREQSAAAKGAPTVPLGERSYLRRGGGDLWSVARDVEVSWRGEGEWKITLDVFRDLGIAFAAACLGIYVLLVYETSSYFMPLILMVSIPLTIIGILPGFWLLHVFGSGPINGFANPIYFTATGMIGMIALSGLAVRNAILLIEFVGTSLEEGKSLEEGLIIGGAVRTRPIFLTAGTAMLAAWPITLDPIFSGLAWALIFGLFVSTAFTLVIIPVIYFMVFAPKSPAPAS